MTIHEQYEKFQKLEEGIKAGRFKTKDRPYQQFALELFEQTDCKTLSDDDAIKAVEMLNALNLKLHQEQKEIGEGSWLSTFAKYKTISNLNLLVFVLYPIGTDKITEEPKICIVEFI
ncbi:MAG: hypothetical protein H7645_05335 [Candidatus Heimdallarchaeota archaeon]|nr:hypothetical protein [Candidatus Heimdallarchaeota archaeon]MCK4769745.1 hypothetical protein [Candidatus Heimdallarchaeota archaeon]